MCDYRNVELTANELRILAKIIRNLLSSAHEAGLNPLEVEELYYKLEGALRD